MSLQPPRGGKKMCAALLPPEALRRVRTRNAKKAKIDRRTARPAAPGATSARTTACLAPD
eukprot:2765751-Pyramimonas_sp.AAC.3